MTKHAPPPGTDRLLHPPGRLGTSTLRLAHAALAILAADYGNPGLHVTTVASRLQVSRWHLARVLRAATGQSFLAHLHRARIAAACVLLIAPELPSMKEIAYEVGYASPREFDRRFRRATGRTPGDYRRSGGSGPRCTASAISSATCATASRPRV